MKPFLASSKAKSIAIFTFKPSASFQTIYKIPLIIYKLTCSFGTGIVIKTPVFIFNLLKVISITFAHSTSSSSLFDTLNPLSETKNSGKISVLNPITATP